jgi:hypothetical protein
MNAYYFERKYQRNKLLVTVLLCVSNATACVFSLAGGNLPERAPEYFPESEIIFDAGGGEIGFMNADGTNLSFLNLGVISEDDDYTYGTLPIMNSLGDTLVFLEVPVSPYHDIIAEGKLVVARVGEVTVVCENWYSERPQTSGEEIYVLQAGTEYLGLYDLDDCADSGNSLPVQTFAVPVWQNTDESVFEKRAPSISVMAPNGQMVVYRSLEDQIVVREIGNGNEVIIGEGDFPSWSRDSQWLAYTGYDGIYIAQTNGTNVHRVFTSDHVGLTSRASVGPSGTFPPPWPSWSPDGKWLVFHMCDGAPYCQTEIGIYKVNVETGEIVKILDHGIFPSWRWPVQP